ncbi:MAG: PAS domain S-box protein [Acidobacteriia bacterium]|nr:PAS domain S-box protein [Terriglobia bacterium]
MSRKLILLAILAVVGTAELLVMVVFYYLGIRAGWLESLVDTAVLIAISAPLLHLVLLRSDRAVRENRELARAYQSLKGLYNLADALKEATTEQDVLDNTMQQVRKFPGVQAGWVSLREGETGFRLAAAYGLPPALEVPGAFEGECLCRRKLLAGELDRTTNILECERLRQAKGDTRGLRLHASIPLWIGNRVIGVMNLVGPEKGLFGDKDLEILYSVGNQVAVALERTHLLHQMENIVEERTAALTAEIAERQQSEEKFRKVLRNIHEVVYSIKVTEIATGGSVELVSDQVRDILGYEPDEFLRDSTLWFRILHPEDVPSVIESTNQIVSNKRPGIRVYRLRHKTTGEYLWLEDSVSPEFDDSGNLSAIFGVARDISERKQAEEKLRESEGHYRSLFENMLNGFAYCRMLFDDGQPQDFIYLSVNQAFERLTGLKDVAGKKVSEVIPGIRESAPDLFELYGRVARTGVPEQCEIYLEALKMWFTISVYCPRQDHFVAVFDVITDRKRAEEALRTSEGKYRQIVETSNEGIWMLDPDGKTIFANRQMAQMLGYSEEELSRLSLFDLTYDSDLADARARMERLRMGEAVQRDLRYRRKDGSELWALASSAPVFDAAGKNAGMLGMLSDITERKRLEKQFRQAQKMEAVGQLAGGVAHDFNNLLGVIIGYSELVEESLKPDDPLRPKIEEIKKAGERGASLTRQLLAFSRQQVLEPKILNLNSVVADVQKMLQRLISEDIELITNCQPNLALVKVDRGQIEQVIMNLAVNARDAMPNGGKLRIETANVDLDDFYARQHAPMVPGSFVMLVITDTGMGMDAETQTHIFEPFFTTKEQGKGTGLGLATVYGIVKQSGGYVWVYSELGQGTIFKIYLPQVQGEAEKEKPSIGPDKLVKETETILLVEDEEALRKMTHELLEQSGYTVLEASDGLEALEIAWQHKGPIHLLLTDVVMPRMSGPALAKPAAALHPELKVLYMSGYTGYSYVSQGLVSSESELLQKPFTRDTLLRKIREVLGV